MQTEVNERENEDAKERYKSDRHLCLIEELSTFPALCRVFNHMKRVVCM